MGSCLILRLRPPTMSSTTGHVPHLACRPYAISRIPRKLLGAEEVFAPVGIIAENQLLAVEEDQVDAPGRVQTVRWWAISISRATPEAPSLAPGRGA